MPARKSSIPPTQKDMHGRDWSKGLVQCDLTIRLNFLFITKAFGHMIFSIPVKNIHVFTLDINMLTIEDA